MTNAATLFSASGPLRGQWLAVACADQIQAGPVAVRLLGNDLVLWRSPSGAVVAAPDRCTHSRRPLSKGSVDEGRLVCAKHGWTFGDAGRCVFKPSGLPITENAHLQTHPCTERHGLVWVCLGEPQAPVVELAGPDDEDNRSGHCEVSVWHANAARIMDAALAQPDSECGSVWTEMPFVIHRVLPAEDGAERHALLTCAPVDGRSSLVASVVWTRGEAGSDAATAATAVKAALGKVRSAVEIADAERGPLSSAEIAPAEGSDPGGWKHRLVSLTQQEARAESQVATG
ncbi:Rieske 2Fe-2S domain-containing protein [Mycobacterium sp. Y57]|uniref:Rieske 2Fe-2S domain-containing protein n=1 Tax=Mycolicibacterium xanthum TaxID=2796469 RepID=UPI001C843465|nr:Rieske 2Fe-2S domain-containing protein [Mycolicibacterium xanthum]MBX7430500.1 Rieske 2Fe-2S domain-containing protein [Mycolicibacterium xanthum]